MLAVVVTGFVLRALTAQGHFVTTDENNWLARSHNFRVAVASGDFASATATVGGINPDAEVATMPGVTTMWVGAVGELVWTAARGAGLVGDRPEPDPSVVTAAAPTRPWPDWSSATPPSPATHPGSTSPR